MNSTAEIILGSALSSTSAVDKMLSSLTEADFPAPHHRALFRKMAELRAQGKPADSFTVPAAINGDYRLFPINPIIYTSGLIEKAQPDAEIERYFDLLKKERAEAPAEALGKAQAHTGTSRRLSMAVQTVAALLKEPDAPTSWLIDSVWSACGRGFVAGNPGVGKTWFCLLMALCVSTGRDFLGKFTVKTKGPVLFISEEEDKQNLRTKIRLLARGMGLSDSELANFHHLTSCAVKFPGDVEEIIGVVKKLGCVAIFIDALRRVHTGNENSSTELQPVLDALARIKTETGAAVVVVHHLNKSNEGNRGKSVFSRMRGSSDLWAWRDCVVALEETTDDESVCKASFQFRDSPETPPFELSRAFDPAKGTATISFQQDQEAADLENAVYEHIRMSASPQSGNALTKALNRQKGRVLKAVKRLHEAGRINFDRDAKGWEVTHDPFAGSGSQNPGTGGNR